MKMKVLIETNTIVGDTLFRNVGQAKEFLDHLVPAVLVNLSHGELCAKAPSHASHGCFHTFRMRISEDKSALTLNEFLSGDQ